MLTANQDYTASREDASQAGGLRPEDITPWDMVCLNEDKLPIGAIVVVPSEWVMQ
jgi:hypothetical protein